MADLLWENNQEVREGTTDSDSSASRAAEWASERKDYPLLGHLPESV